MTQKLKKTSFYNTSMNKASTFPTSLFRQTTLRRNRYVYSLVSCRLSLYTSNNRLRGSNLFDPPPLPQKCYSPQYEIHPYDRRSDFDTSYLHCTQRCKAGTRTADIYSTNIRWVNVAVYCISCTLVGWYFITTARHRPKYSKVLLIINIGGESDPHVN